MLFLASLTSSLLSPVSVPGNLGPPIYLVSPSYLNPHPGALTSGLLVLSAYSGLLPLGFLWSPGKMVAGILLPIFCC